MRTKITRNGEGTFHCCVRYSEVFEAEVARHEERKRVGIPLRVLVLYALIFHVGNGYRWHSLSRPFAAAEVIA
jgi:hypothetical protein